MTLAVEQLDNRVEIVTPENIALHYQLAGPFRRFCAYFVDALIRVLVIAICVFVAFVIGIFGAVIAPGAIGLGVGMLLIVWFLLEWFYGGLFESIWNGQTPGKRMLGIRVLSVRGQPINPWQAILRNILRAADALPVLPTDVPIPTYQVGLLVMCCNRRFQRIGDLICGTIVVVEESQRLFGVSRVTDTRAIELAESLPAKLKASRNLSLALSSYVQRRLTFGEKRRAEIARHLGEPLCVRWGLPANTDHDLLLCALYYRLFITDRADDQRGQSPFQQPATGNFVIAEAVEMEVPRTMSRPRATMEAGG